MPDVITCISEGDDPSGRRRQGVNRSDDTGRPAQGCEPGARARETRPPAVTGKPVCEPHDSTGEPGVGNRHAGLCVQRRLVCSAGDSPAGVRIRSPVAWIAGRRETEFLKPIDKVSLGEIASYRAATQVNALVASRVPYSEGRARNPEAKAA